MNRRSWLAGLAALTITPPLVRAFVHDSDTALTHYDGRQVLIRVGSGDPYRNQDVTVNFSTKPQGMSLRLTFRSDGQPDEFVSLHGVLDPNVQAQAYLNNVLVAEWYVGGSLSILNPVVEYADRGTFWQHNDFFASPFLLLHPGQGQHELELRILPAPDDNNRNFFYDGYGYALRGGPF